MAGPRVNPGPPDGGIALPPARHYLWRATMPRADMTSLFQILMLLLSVAKFVVLAHLIMSWLVNFQVLNLRQPLVYQVWSGLNRLLEPLYGPIRRMLPNLGGIDLSPLIVLVGIYAAEIILRNNIGLFV
jgi:YggT family protein